jgi:small conductance mechanosensitive channel
MNLSDNNVLIAVVGFLLRLGAALLVYVIGRWLAGRARTWLHIAMLTGLALIGVPIEALLGASLIIVVILGIALQQSIANLAATIVFLLFQPFRLGELIKANGVLGTVKEIQFFSTVLVTGDNLEVTIPNAKIQGDNLLNYTRLGRLRIDFVFGVSYHDDLEKVKQVLYEILNADERVLADPAPFVFVQSLDDSSVTFAVRPWVKPDDYWTLQWDMPGKVKQRFDAEGISIPFPQRDVHLYQPDRPTPPTNQSTAFSSKVLNNVVTSSAVNSNEASPTDSSDF